MKFGIHGPADIDMVAVYARAEQLGFDEAWFGDNPLIWSDTSIVMAEVARATKKLVVGSGITVAGLRLATVTANAAATINRMAPGRVAIGLGTGYSGYQNMGHSTPIKIKDFRAEAIAIRELVAGREVDFEFNGVVKPIKFQMTHKGFVNVEDHIPIYLAAMGPKAQQLAGEVADGIYASWGQVSEIEGLRERLRAGAAKSGRSLDNFAIYGPAGVIVLEPGEDPTSDRVMVDGGLTVAMILHNMYHKFGRAPADQLPPFLAPFWDKYCDMMEAYPERTRHYRTDSGHGTYIDPEELQFITPQLVQMFNVIKRPEEMVETLREWDTAGITHFTVYCGYPNFERNMENFAKHVLKKL